MMLMMRNIMSEMMPTKPHRQPSAVQPVRNIPLCLEPEWGGGRHVGRAQEAEEPEAPPKVPIVGKNSWTLAVQDERPRR